MGFDRWRAYFDNSASFTKYTNASFSMKETFTLFYHQYLSLCPVLYCIYHNEMIINMEDRAGIT